MSLNDWLGAFLLTQAIEVPIYLAFAPSLPWPRRLLYAFGASTITHPILWFCLPWASAPYVLLLVVAELSVVIVEIVWGRWLGVRRAVSASCVANMISLAVGLVVREMFFSA